MTASGATGDPDRDLLASLAGTQAGRACEIAHRTRRVVAASCGVLQEQKAGRERTRSLVLAVTIVVPLLLAPFVGWAVDELVAGGHLNDPASQVALWICMLCPALAAAVLVGGWMRR
ncbi:MAG: hypothetical protein WCE75_01715 [Terracidiphilus sp.]